MEPSESSLSSSTEMEQTVNGARAAVPVNIDTAQTIVSQNIGLEQIAKETIA